jgi:PAS domain S-box-containing protein
MSNFSKLSISILYVEDEKTLYSAVMDFVSLLVARIDHAKNGQEALELYNNNKYDLILTDINMPIMDGIELIRRVRQNERNTGENIDIMITSAFSDVKFFQEAIKLGVGDYVLKPLDFSLLTTKLEQLSNKVLKKRIQNVINETTFIVEFDENFNAVFVNDSFLEFSGYSKAELINQNIFTLMFENGENIAHIISDSLKKVSKYSRILKAYTKDKKTVHMSINIQELTGDSVYAVAIISDNTKEVESKQHIRQLQKSQENLLKNLAHEVFTPLNAITNYAKFIEEDIEDPEIKDFSLRIIDNSQYLTRLVQQTMKLSSLPTMKYTLNTASVEEVLEHLQNNYNCKHSTIIQNKKVYIHYGYMDEMINATIEFINSFLETDQYDIMINITERNFQIGIKVFKAKLPYYLDDVNSLAKPYHLETSGSQKNDLGMAIASIYAQKIHFKLDIQSIDKDTIVFIYKSEYR